MDSTLEAQLSAMELPEGAFLVASFDESVSYEAAERAMKQIGRARDAVGKSNPVLILARGVRLESLNDEQLAHLGLMRIPTDGEPTKENGRPVAGAGQRVQGHDRCSAGS